MKRTACIILIFFFTTVQMIDSCYANFRNISFLNDQSNEYTYYLRSDYIAQNTAKKKRAKKKPEEIELETLQQSELESPLRRFEITFFISAPFVFIITFLTLHTYDVIKRQDPDVNVWKDYKPALLIGTFGISTGIAAREAWKCKEYNDKKRKEESRGFTNQTLFLYVYKKF